MARLRVTCRARRLIYCRDADAIRRPAIDRADAYILRFIRLFEAMKMMSTMLFRRSMPRRAGQHDILVAGARALARLIRLSRHAFFDDATQHFLSRYEYHEMNI